VSCMKKKTPNQSKSADKKRYLALAKRLRKAKDPEEVRRIKRQLAQITFGG
jgi:hypothetical protein